jgi:hypothetical protein
LFSLVRYPDSAEHPMMCDGRIFADLCFYDHGWQWTLQQDVISGS